jgi:hypothetical protein
VTTRAGTPTIADAGRLSVLLVTGWLAARAVADPDLWGHVRFGLDTLNTQRLTSVDPYSFTQDLPWINHEWLSEVLFAVAYRLGGVLGLVLLKSTVLVTVACLLAALTRQVDAHLRWWLLAVALVSLGPMSGTFRPQLWTILGLALVCRVLTSGSSLAWLVAIFPIWANLHGGWIVGAGLVALWSVGRLFDTRSLRTALPIVAALGVAVAATALNPYGVRLWMFLLRTVRMSRDISEWRPLWQQPDVSHSVLWALIAGVVLVSAVLGWRRVTWAAVLPVAWLGVSSLFVDRLMPLFGEISLLVTILAWKSNAPVSTEAPIPPRPAEQSPARNRAARQTPGPQASGRWVVDVVLVAIVWISGASSAARCLPIAGPWAPDLSAAGLLASPDARGRLVLPFDWGQYALWHFGPRLRVSMDGRRETVYSDQTVTLQSAVARGLPEGLDYLKGERPEYVWLPAQTAAPVAVWLRANGYRITENGRSFVAERIDLPPLVAGPPLSRCFP